jgi:hypothetical protein
MHTKEKSCSVFEWKGIGGGSQGVRPPSRWGHSSCIVGEELYIFGGFASNC